MFRKLYPFIVSALLASSLHASDGSWLRRVPSHDRERPNPYASREDAILAGGAIFQQNCAKCHGRDATGAGRHPSLRTELVRHATDGELFWLLTNGSMARGMPSWSKLPEAQRWQLIRYLHSLPLEDAR